MTSKISNSEIGSSHWLNTILGNILRIGEYMIKHKKLTKEQCTDYGESCYHGSREILDWFSVHPLVLIESQERFILKKLKEKYESTNQDNN